MINLVDCLGVLGEVTFEHIYSTQQSRVISKRAAPYLTYTQHSFTLASIFIELKNNHLRFTISLCFISLDVIYRNYIIVHHPHHHSRSSIKSSNFINCLAAPAPIQFHPYVIRLTIIIPRIMNYMLFCFSNMTGISVENIKCSNALKALISIARSAIE